MVPTRLGDAECRPLNFRADSATLNAPSTVTVLGRDPEMRRNVTTAPQPELREKDLGSLKTTRNSSCAAVIKYHACSLSLLMSVRVVD